MQVKKEVIDDYRLERVLPYFALGMKLKDGATPKPLRTNIHFNGVGEPAYIRISRDPESPGGS